MVLAAASDSESQSQRRETSSLVKPMTPTNARSPDAGIASASLCVTRFATKLADSSQPFWDEASDTTEKPVELATRAMEYSSKPGENVLDLFGGSGSTLIGAEQTGRRAFLMELDPLYCDVIIQRYEQFTGKKAERLA